MFKQELTKIVLELNQIKQLLENKNNIEVDTNTGQIAHTVQGDQNQNIYNAYNTFNLPPKKFPENEIQTRFVFHTLRVKIFIYSYFAILLTIFSLTWFKFYFLLVGIVLFIMFLFSLKKWKANLIIEDDKLILKTIDRNKIGKILKKIFEDKNEEIYFKDIHSFLKEKDLLGYQFFIYNKNEIEPKFGFTFFSIHKAIAIEELLKYKISEANKPIENQKKSS